MVELKNNDFDKNVCFFFSVFILRFEKKMHFNTLDHRPNCHLRLSNFRRRQSNYFHNHYLHPFPHRVPRLQCPPMNNWKSLFEK